MTQYNQVMQYNDMKTRQFTNNKTPIRLQEDIYKAFVEAYAGLIEAHGASFAVNTALAQQLRHQGFDVAVLDTPGDRIASGQRKRWASVKEVAGAAQAKLEAQQERKRLRDRERRARIKAEREELALLKKQTTFKVPEEE